MARRKIDVPPLSGLEVFELVNTDGFAVELGDADAETEEHPFDLVMQALVDRKAAGGF